MFESELLMSLYSPKLSISQMPVEIDVPFDHPDIGGLMFLSPQFFVALIAGVIMAFGFQFLLTNFSIAAKISNWDEALPDDDDDDESETLGSKVRKIEGLVGGWILVTVNLALFLACFLAVKLTSIASVDGAAIIGVVIWAAYFLTLVWLGSSAVGSMIGSLIKTAFSGVQGVMGTAGAAIGGKMANDQMVNTVEASVAAVRRELSSAVDPESIRETLQDYVGSLQLPKLDVKEIRGQFEKLLGDVDIKPLAGSDVLKNVNRQTFVDLIKSRTDFSQEEINQVADQLEGVWKQTFGQQQEQKDPNVELVDFLKFAAPDLLKSDELNAKLSQILESRENKSESGSPMKRAMQLGVGSLVNTVLSRTDLSDLDVEKITGQLQQLTAKGTEQAKSLASKVGDKVPALPFNTAKADVENYLMNAQPWHLNRETIKQEFRDVIYDPEASPGAVLRQLELFNPDYFVGILSRREGFTPEQAAEIAEQLEAVRQEVLEIVQAAAGEEQSQDLRSRIENYLRSTGKEELNPEGIERDFQALLEDRDAGFDALRDRLSQFNRDTLVQLLGQREDFSPEEADQLIGRLESSRDSVISRAQELQEQAKSKAQELRQKVEDYLRNTNKEELNPEAIEREFQTLLNDPEAGFKALRERLSQFDRDTLVQLLSQRQDLSEEQITQAIDRIESVRDNIIHAPQIVADKAKEQYEEVTAKIGEYLRNTNLEELDPEGINRDLTKLFENPKEGALALRDRLSQVDRETLVKLLSQREDLSEEQIERTIDRVQDSIRSIVKSPRRLASRAQKTVRDFQGSLENYLRNTDKEALNPEGIKRDLQLLFSEPGMGMQSLGDRVKHFDRDTLVALLSQREDISEEEANRIADQIESVRNQIVEQVQMVQDKLQSAIDGIFGKIRDYLNSLDRPELNYEGIKRDFRKVFDDPQAGFDAIKERLGEFDRGTLVALLSSRSDISETDAHRIVDQIEGARDSVLLRAERLQTEAKKRIKQLKKKTKQQAEDAREAAATAAWWLFGTALTSVVVSALAGAIAVNGISGLFS
ncbi:MFS transporter [Microcoleus vaginatus GB1-A2]|uniref:MFS transporter n=1 Tax=Microcoleus vaginatus TaxID=119532 RepID=UPI001682AB1C|nr:MFS transporter [Microcoleus sp. FACHB-61]